MQPLVKPHTLASALLPTTILGGLPAAAEDVAQLGLETVTVTAQKIGEQDLQRVPLSITVLDTGKLEELHVDDFRDFVRFLPPVSFTAGGQGMSGGPGQSTISMRGVTDGADGNHSGPLPTVHQRGRCCPRRRASKATSPAATASTCMTGTRICKAP